jgi:thiol-disulfide isomerase/thioredoxin
MGRTAADCYHCGISTPLLPEEVVMVTFVLALIAVATPGDLKSDYANLETQSTAVERASEAWRADQKNDGLRDKWLEASKQFREAEKKFVTTYGSGAMKPEFATLLVKSTDSKALDHLEIEEGLLRQHTGLTNTWAAETLEAGHAKEFLAGCDALEKAGLKAETAESLASLRAIAMYATGQEKQAEELVTKLAEKQGARGLELIDIHAAMLAGRGKYQEAHDLYENYAQKFGKKGDQGADYAVKMQMIGKPAPDVVASTWLAPGGEVTPGWKGLEDLKGGVVLLDFWQTWCGPCRAVMPSLSTLQSKFKPEDARIIGMCCNDGNPGFDYATQKSVDKAEIAGDKYVPHVQKFMKDIKLTYWVGIADDRKNNTAYQIRGIPTLVVLDADGNVAWLTVGASPGVEMLLETLIHKLSGGTG